MRSTMGGIVLCGLLVAAGMAWAGDEGGANHAKLARSLRIALVLNLSDDLDLNEQQTVELVRSFIKHDSVICSLRKQRAALREELTQAGATAGVKLDELIRVDQQLRQSEGDAAQQVGANLTADQRAKVYLLLSTMDDCVESILGDRATRAAKARKQQAGGGENPGAVPAEAAEAVVDASPQQAVAATLEGWEEGVKAADLEKIMAAYSESFQHEEYGDKPGVRVFLKNAIDTGYLEGVRVSVKEAQVEVHGNDATAYPVELGGDFGTGTIKFKLKNEDAVWRIVGMELFGL